MKHMNTLRYRLPSSLYRRRNSRLLTACIGTLSACQILASAATLCFRRSQLCVFVLHHPSFQVSKLIRQGFHSSQVTLDRYRTACLRCSGDERFRIPEIHIFPFEGHTARLATTPLTISI
jgi:hypothetical protein